MSALNSNAVLFLADHCQNYLPSLETAAGAADIVSYAVDKVYEKIKHYLEPEFKREDLLQLLNSDCIARLFIDNAPPDPFFLTKNI